MSSQPARTAAFAALGLLGLLLLGGAAAVVERAELAEWLVVRELAARGVPAQLHVVRLDLRGAELADVKLGSPVAPDLALAHASLAWSLAGLRAERLDRIALRGLRLRARVDGGGVRLGTLDALFAGGAREEGEPLVLPFLEAALSDAEAVIDSPQGALRLRAEGSATPEADLVRATLTLHGESPQGAVDFGGGGTVGLISQEIGAVGVLAGQTPWGRVDGNVRVFGTLSALRAEFSGSVQPDAAALRVSASESIAVTGFATRENGAFAGEAKFAASNVEARDSGAVCSVSGDARFREEGGVLSADLAFDAGGVSLKDVGSIASAEGKATVRGDDARASFVLREIEAADLGRAARATVNARLDLASDALSADATFSADGLALTDVASAASAEGKASVRGDDARASFALREIDAPDLARTARATVSARLDLASDALSAHIEAHDALAPDLARLHGVVAELRYANDTLAGDVHVAKLVELSQPALIAPLQVDAKLSGPPRRIRVSGKARTPGDGLVFDFSGALEPERGRAELRIVLPETDLAPNTRQPDRVFPWLAGSIERARGPVGGEALVSYEDDTLGASALIALNGVDLVTEQGTMRGLMGVLSFTGIDPLVTPPGQTLWMQSAEVGLPLGNGTVKFQLRADGVLFVERGEWAFAGGKLAFSGAIPLDASERRLELAVESISVEQLLAALDLEGLEGTGTLGGTAPLVQHGEQMLISDAALRATETGVIRFTSGEGGAALTRKQPALAPVLGALENLQYEELTLTMNGDISDRVEAKLHIRGRNPNFQKGRPVVLNVNVDLPLGSLLRAAAVATGVPDEIEAKVQKAIAKEKP